MTDHQASFKRFEAMSARLAPFDRLVRRYVKAWGDRHDLLATGRKASRSRVEKAAELDRRMREDWPVVNLVRRSQQLIAKLFDEARASTDGSYDFDQAALVDAWWVQIRALVDVVPLAQKGAKFPAGGRVGRKGQFTLLVEEAAMLAQEAGRAAAKEDWGSVDWKSVVGMLEQRKDVVQEVEWADEKIWLCGEEAPRSFKTIKNILARLNRNDG